MRGKLHGERLLTLDQIQTKGWALANRCFLCQVCESINHLLVHYKKTREVWKLFFILFGVCWVFPSSVIETFLGWDGAWVGKKGRIVWKVRLLCLFWSVWKARNRVAFEDGVLSLQRLKASFVFSLWSKTKLSIKTGPLMLINFIDWVGSK